MNEQRLRTLLEAVRTGEQTPDEAVQLLRTLPFEDLGFARIDHHRAIRCGYPEVIYCAGKTADQVVAIFDRCVVAGGDVLATRATPDVFQAVRARHPEAVWHDLARAITYRQSDVSLSPGTIAIVAAGTGDLPVAEEARITADMMAQRTATLYDVGVAGIHRLLSQAKVLHAASVIVVVAGMDGALPGVVGGLVDCPVIAVPTSVGYGANFGGLSALLTMLNACAAGITVVNIDNGFGGGYAAAVINRRIEPRAADGRGDA